jgi:hypothetical protein
MKPHKTKPRSLQGLRNLGPKMVQYLGEIGITNEQDLRTIHPVECYLKLKMLHPKVMNRMALYAIYGALTNQDCMRLPQETKDWLEQELQLRKPL